MHRESRCSNVCQLKNSLPTILLVPEIIYQLIKATSFQEKYTIVCDLVCNYSIKEKIYIHFNNHEISANDKRNERYLVLSSPKIILKIGSFDCTIFDPRP